MPFDLFCFALFRPPVTTTEVNMAEITKIYVLLTTMPGHLHTSSALLPLPTSKLAAMVRQSCRNPTCKHTNSYIAAEKVVQVPTMAESITEGTLKQFSKRELKPRKIINSYI